VATGAVVEEDRGRRRRQGTHRPVWEQQIQAGEDQICPPAAPSSPEPTENSE
jgi:hypothetical protein